jgi:hypothetical protein
MPRVKDGFAGRLRVIFRQTLQMFIVARSVCWDNANVSEGHAFPSRVRTQNALSAFAVRRNTLFAMHTN